VEGIIYAIITVIAWGAWLAPSQNVEMQGQQTRTFFVTLAVMVTAFIVALFNGISQLNLANSWAPFLGGILWAASAWSAFVGSKHLGMAKAFGIWAPLNIVVSILWGMILFGEFLEAEIINLAIGIAALIAIATGILLIIFSGNDTSEQSPKLSIPGLMGAIGAGVGFASYFVPIQLARIEVNLWLATFPMSIGMFVGGSILAITSRSSLRLKNISSYSRVLATGLIWSIGNYGALRMMELIGTGKGFTIAQLCVVVNALIGIFIMKNPAPKSKAAKMTLIGVITATIGGTVIGNLNF